MTLGGANLQRKYLQAVQKPGDHPSKKLPPLEILSTFCDPQVAVLWNNSICACCISWGNKIKQHPRIQAQLTRCLSADLQQAHQDHPQ